MHLLTTRGQTPAWGADCWFAPSATLIGDVIMGERCTVWFNAVVRGDVHAIRIGSDTNIQDNATLHCTYQRAGLTIGSRVSIAHNAVVHGCTIADEVLIGMGAIVMDNAVVNTHCIVAAGAIVLQNQILEAGFVYAGQPAKKLKETTPEQIEIIRGTAQRYPMYAGWFEKP